MKRRQVVALNRLLLFNLATDADDPILGFTSDWLRALAVRIPEIDVLTMRAGRIPPLANVHVHSVGQERGFSEPRRALNFYTTLQQLLARHRYQACFAHMMPLFAAMGAPLLRRQRIPITLWYVHSGTPLTLRIAERLVDQVVTASPAGFELSNAKVHVLGHGIDTDLFRPPDKGVREQRPFQIVAVGRIAPVKRIESMVDVLTELCLLLPPPGAVLELIGPVDDRDREYLASVKERARRQHVADRLKLLGPQPRSRLPTFIANADVALNLTPGGSFDKSALESMACGVPLVTVNALLQSLVVGVEPRLIPRDQSALAVASACVAAFELDSDRRQEVGRALRAAVVVGHSLDRLADRLVPLLTQGSAARNGSEP